MNKFHKHTSSYAPPAAPAPGMSTATQSGLVLDYDVNMGPKIQHPLTSKTAQS